MIKRVKPRVFKEFVNALFEVGAVVNRCHDRMERRIFCQEVIAMSREVRKNGKPIGPWILSPSYQLGPYEYYIHDSDVDGVLISITKELTENAKRNLPDVPTTSRTVGTK